MLNFLKDKLHHSTDSRNPYNLFSIRQRYDYMYPLRDAIVAGSVDSKSIVEKNKSALEEKKKSLTEELTKLKEQFNQDAKALKTEHLANNTEIS